jgi:hypothetical protein
VLIPDKATFEITVALPAEVPHYKDLTTDLAAFAHDVGDFFRLYPTTFDAVRLKTSNAPIYYEVRRRYLLLEKFTLAHIIMIFAGVRCPLVVCAKQQCHGRGILRWFRRPHANQQRAYPRYRYDACRTRWLRVVYSAPNVEWVSLTVSTFLSPSNYHLSRDITAKMGLVSELQNNVLTAMVSTSRGAIDIETPPGPITAPNLTFFLDASTSFGPATVSLYSEYEGTYDVQTSRASAGVEEVTDWRRDPSGRGRRRTVRRMSTGQRAWGEIWWRKDGEPTEGVHGGYVKLSTSRSPVKLYI